MQKHFAALKRSKVQPDLRSENQNTSLIQQGRYPIVLIAPGGEGDGFKQLGKEGSVFGLLFRLML